MTSVAVYAGFWRRFVALLLDSAFVWTLVWAAWSITGEGAGAFVGWLAGQVYLVGTSAQGGTLGKRAMGMRLVRADGRNVRLDRAIFREVIGKQLLSPMSSILGLVFLVAVADPFAGVFGSTVALLPVLLPLGYLWMLWDARRQTWHDKVADTVVVRELAPPPAPEWSIRPPWVVTGAPGRPTAG